MCSRCNIYRNLYNINTLSKHSHVMLQALSMHVSCESCAYSLCMLWDADAERRHRLATHRTPCRRAAPRIRCSTSTAPHNMQVIPIIYTPALHHIIIMVNVKLGYELHLTYPSVKMGFNALLRLIGSASVVSKHNNVSLVNCYVWVRRMPVVPKVHDGVFMIWCLGATTEFAYKNGTHEFWLWFVPIIPNFMLALPWHDLKSLSTAQKVTNLSYFILPLS